MMWQPVGRRGSPNHHQVVLENWARVRNVDVGRPARAGWAMYVSTLNGEPTFVCEHRGPGFPPFHMTFPFPSTGGRLRVRERQHAFARAIAIYRRLSRQEEAA